MQSLWRRQQSPTTPRKRARRKRTAMHILTDCVSVNTRPSLSTYAETWGDDDDNDVEWSNDIPVPVPSPPRDVADELAALDAADKAHKVDRSRAIPHDAPFNAARRLRNQWIADSMQHNRILGNAGDVDDDVPDIRLLSCHYRTRANLNPS